MTSGTHQSLHVGYRTSVDCQAKFFVLASEITRIIVEATIVRGNNALCLNEISCEMSRSIAKFGPNFFANFRAKVRENKERNSRISFALLFHNTVPSHALDLADLAHLQPHCNQELSWFQNNRVSIISGLKNQHF